MQRSSADSYAVSLSLNDVKRTAELGEKFIKGLKVRVVSKAEMRRLVREHELNSSMANYTYSKQQLEEVGKEFDEALAAHIAGTLPQGYIYNLGVAGEALQMSGIPALPIELRAKKLEEKSKQENHVFDKSLMFGLVDAVQNPIAVFQSKSFADRAIVLSEIKQGNNNFVVVLETEYAKGRIFVNDVRSIYPKGGNEIALWIRDGLLTYKNEEKLRNWLSQQRSNSAEVRKTYPELLNAMKAFKNMPVNRKGFQKISAYHGSAKRFATDKDRPFGWFNDDKLAGGYFGWGHYFTSKEEAANAFAKESRVSGKGKKAYVYTAEIDFGENDENLLDWDAELTPEQKERLAAQAEREGMDDVAEELREGDYTVNDLHTIDNLLEFETERERSEFLRRAGFVGHVAEKESDNPIYVIYSGADANITGRARYQKARGYMDGGEWSVRANEALVAGLRPAAMLGAEIGVSREAYASQTDPEEWHHVGDNFERVDFFDPSGVPLTDAGQIEDEEGAASFLRYLEMLRYDLGVHPVEERGMAYARKQAEKSGKAWDYKAYIAEFERARDASYLLNKTMRNRSREALEAFKEEYGKGADADFAKLRELGASALQVLRELSKDKASEVKAFLSENPNWKRATPPPVSRGANDVRYQRGRVAPTAEEAKIEREAKANGTWLKAPNGADSKLSPRQWVQVRTKAFKKWFGDWEKNPAGASKVVDANGEPLVVYHGSREDGYHWKFNPKTRKEERTPRKTHFTEFKTNRWNYVWMSSDKSLSAEFSGTTIPAHLRMDEYDEYDDDWRGRRGFYPLFANIRNPLVVDAQGEDWMHVKHNGTEKSTNAITRSAKVNGYDGVIVRNVKESYRYEDLLSDDFVAFDSEQVKSATDNAGTFDGGNADIRFQESGAGNKPLVDEDGEVYGFFNPETGEVVVSENARIDTVMHEVLGHATWAWAKQNAPELHAKLVEYAQNAPQEIVDEVRANYPDLDEGSEEFAEEVFAFALSAEHSGKIAELLQNEDARGWWARLRAWFVGVWRRMLSVLGRDRVDVGALAELDYASAVRELAEAYAAGKTLGQIEELNARSSGWSANAPWNMSEAQKREYDAAKLRKQKAKKAVKIFRAGTFCFTEKVFLN